MIPGELNGTYRYRGIDRGAFRKRGGEKCLSRRPTRILFATHNVTLATINTYPKVGFLRPRQSFAQFGG